ncbi:hypothetical protein [Staphylococcus aureus]|uniref:Lipoprotein n=1 Tax=Staphylococcus aureus TaxID=1280 RepID=A0AA40MJ40_STAAU|nr:hypothetical protein [Staphylococcus aureus]KIU00519.1 hypothetical protein QU38_02810 [Staphylococcus aureus]
MIRLVLPAAALLVLGACAPETPPRAIPGVECSAERLGALTGKPRGQEAEAEALRFSGAPSGTGGFGIEGVRMAPVLGTLGVGIDARASRNVRLGIALEGSAGENTREGRASVRVKIGF